MVQLHLVVPCYNEAARLKPDVFLKYLAAEERLAFVFVNDGSTDETASILRGMESSGNGRVRAMSLEKNVGKAGAVQCGIVASLQHQPKLVGYWDADLSTPLDAIPEFLAVLDNYPAVDIVMGARVALLGRRIHRVASRHYLGRVFATAASLALGLTVYDTQCGAKVFRGTERVRQAFASPFVSKWIFDVEVLARYIAGGPHGDVESRIYELPLHNWTDVPGSKVTLVDGVRAFADLARIWRTYRTPKSVG